MSLEKPPPGAPVRHAAATSLPEEDGHGEKGLESLACGPGPPRPGHDGSGSGFPGLAVVVVGAYLLDLPVFFLTGDEARPAQQTAPLMVSDNSTMTTTDFKLLNVSYRAGDCITWDQDRQADRTTVAVPCDQPHLIEITGWVDLSGLDKFPSEAEWKSIKRSRECPEQAEQYLGYPLDPFGRFQANGIIPVSDTWSRGDKGVWCSQAMGGRQLPRDRRRRHRRHRRLQRPARP